MPYIYKFLDEQDNVIYIGRTNNIIRRIRNEHFSNTKQGHLPQACYNQTANVHYAEVASQNEAKMYELYYIEQYHPIYNQADIGGGAFSFELEALIWQEFDFNQNTTNKKTKQEIVQHIQSFQEEIADECNLIESTLRGKDTYQWLDKLDSHERNEYLKVIYSFERFVKGIAERNTEVQKELV